MRSEVVAGEWRVAAGGVTLWINKQGASSRAQVRDTRGVWSIFEHLMMFGARRFQQFFRYASGRNMSLALSRMGENPSMKYYLTPFLGIIVGGALLVR